MDIDVEGIDVDFMRRIILDRFRPHDKLPGRNQDHFSSIFCGDGRNVYRFAVSSEEQAVEGAIIGVRPFLTVYGANPSDIDEQDKAEND
jgi:hypothetical protein